MQPRAQAINSVPTAAGGGGVGSNSWTWTTTRTASGSALLANDPHLGPSIPGLFDQVGLRCRVVDEQCPYDVRGFSRQSLPGVAIGHNGDIAWGGRRPYVDTTDLSWSRSRGSST